CIAAKTKLQNPHTGKTEAISKRFNVRRNHAQVFRDYRHLAQRFPYSSEQFFAGRRHPTPTFRSLIAARYFPTRSKTAEVIDARDVECLERGADAINPPFETIGPHLLPVVERIPPELAGGAEIIGRHSRYHDRSPIFVQLKLIRVCPNVCRIVGDENRNVADNLDAAAIAVSLKRKPLPEEEELIKLLRLDFFFEFLPGNFQCLSFSSDQRRIPFIPGDPAMLIFQSPKQSVVVEPGGMLRAKLREVVVEF